MIQSGKVVDLIYTLKDSHGEELDVSTASEPFVYLHGAQQIVPGLEQALEGLNLGDKKQVTVTPEDGYGVSDPKLKMQVKRDQFPDDAELEIGMQFQVQTEDNESIVFTVESFDEKEVSVDGNHPLADETLHFEVEVAQIRDATEEEIAHGHAHGADGHHHHEHDHDESDGESGEASSHHHVHGENCNH
jgi:FKBP-type peptidyl-prolyl cis-trans isomerase SlyD